jgi:predicted deacylase
VHALTEEYNYPIELTPPDISAYAKGNTGIDYATSFDSGKAGPHVCVSALVHGNELCGAIAADWLMREGVRPRQGKLSFLFCNIGAYLSFDPKNPQASRFVDEDFNRLWNEETLDGPRRSAELARARAIRPFIDTVDLLLDIHSMQHATPPLMLCGPLDKGKTFARDVSVPEFVVADAGHAAGKRLRDYAGFGDPASPRNALLVECGQHWEKKSADVAKETALRFLLATGAVSRDWIEPRLAPKPVPQKIVEVTQAVTIRSDDFAFAKPYIGLETIPNAGTLLATDGAEKVLTPYDDCVLIMPSKRLGKGQTAVRLGRYVG